VYCGNISRSFKKTPVMTNVMYSLLQIPTFYFMAVLRWNVEKLDVKMIFPASVLKRPLEAFSRHLTHVVNILYKWGWPRKLNSVYRRARFRLNLSYLPEKPGPFPAVVHGLLYADSRH
jgi:hypothetical protein